MLKNIWVVTGLAIFLVIFGLSVYLGHVFKVEAAGQGDLDNVELHILTEASDDNGATWKNFAGSEFARGETLNLAPGQTILVRARIWNTGAWSATNTEIIGDFDNVGLVDNGVVTDTNLDGDARNFVGFTMEDGGAGAVSAVMAGSTQDVGYEGLQGTITFANNIPDGQSIIIGGVLIHDYVPQLIVRNNPFFRVAHAEGVNNFSFVRGVFNQAHASIGQGKTTPTPTPNVNSLSTLPSTGASLKESINNILHKN